MPRLHHFEENISRSQCSSTCPSPMCLSVQVSSPNEQVCSNDVPVKRPMQYMNPRVQSSKGVHNRSKRIHNRSSQRSKGPQVHRSKMSVPIFDQVFVVDTESEPRPRTVKHVRRVSGLGRRRVGPWRLRKPDASPPFAQPAPIGAHVVPSQL